MDSLSMMSTIRNWLSGRWRLVYDPSDVAKAYHQTFTSALGQVVLQHMMDEVYCKVYEGNDPMACVAFNGRRSVIHDILTTMDGVENPAKYSVRQMIEMHSNGDN